MSKSYLNRRNAEDYPIGDAFTGGDPWLSKTRRFQDPVTAGVTSAAASIGGSLIGGSAAKSAAAKQADAADAALKQQGAGAIASIENARQVLADQLRTADETSAPQIKAQIDALNNQLQVAQQTRDAQLGIANQVWDAQKGYYTPYQTAGLSGQNQLLNYLGLGADKSAAGYGKYATAEFTPEMFKQGVDPGYAFRLEQGLKGLDRQAAARGGLISGNALKAASGFAGDQASQEYQNAYNRYQTTRQNTLAPYQALQGVGLNAADRLSTAAGNYGTNAMGAYGGYGAAAGNAYGANANNLTNIYGGAGGQRFGAYGNYGNQFTGALTGYGNNASNLITGAGNAQAAGTVGAANAMNQGISGATNAYYQNQMLGLLGNRNSVAMNSPQSGFNSGYEANMGVNFAGPSNYG